MIDAPQRFRIGELARRVGTTPRAVRYYEELGLLPGYERPDGGHRMYDEGDAERLRQLLHIRTLLGLSLTELREWMDAEDARARLRERWYGLDEGDEAPRADIIREGLDHVGTQLALVRTRLSDLEQLEDDLAATRRRLRTMLADMERA